MCFIEKGLQDMRELDDITGEIIDAALKVHQGLGPGLLESVYESVLAKALEKRGFKVERQKLGMMNTGNHHGARRQRIQSL